MIQDLYFIERICKKYAKGKESNEGRLLQRRNIEYEEYLNFAINNNGELKFQSSSLPFIYYLNSIPFREELV